MIITPPSLEEGPELDLLVERLKSGDDKALQELILGHIKIAQQIANNWCRRTGRDRDQLEAEALFLLTLAVNKARKKLTDNNIGPYINKYITRNLLKWLYTHRMLKASVVRLKQLKVEVIPVTVPLVMESMDDSGSDNLVDHKEMERRSLSDLTEAIEFCIKTEEERKIFTFRICGYTQRKIAALMGISKTHVVRVQLALEARFRKELE